MSEEGYRVPDVCRIVGISYRQLDYWARTGLVTPSIRDAHGSGTQRLYSFQDLVSLKVIKKLLDTGVSLQRVRKAVEHLRSMKRPPARRDADVGRTRCLRGPLAGGGDRPPQEGAGVFAIALDQVWNDLEGTISKRRRAAAGGS